MASISDSDDSVILNITDPHQSESEAGGSEIVLSTAEMTSWDLPTILGHQLVVVKVNRNRLMEHSSYFCSLLSGSFSESRLDCVFINWNVETFTTILKIIYGFPLEVTSRSFLPLFEGALFFGVETVLLKCKAWLFEVNSSKETGLLKIQLDDLIHIWRFGTEQASDFIPDICTSYLARNFVKKLALSNFSILIIIYLRKQMWAINFYSFRNIPYNFLVSCIKHHDLNTNSEKHLADALIDWLAANTEQFESSGSTGFYCHILKEVRLGLLPLFFATGRKRCRYFSEFAGESIEVILNLINHPPSSSINVLEDVDSHHLKIRLGKYTQKIDLSGCPQMKPTLLLLSMLTCSSSTDLLLTKAEQSRIGLECHDQDPPSLPILSFEAVLEVNISNCPSLYLEGAIHLFSKSFPSLTTLRATHHLAFKIKKLRELVQKCPLLVEVDLTVDISPLIPKNVSIVSSSAALTSRIPRISAELDGCAPRASDLYFPTNYRLVTSNITKLTLEGRVDVTDYDLKGISGFCASLSYLNLRGCTSVTDAGISNLILSVNLDSLLVCDTLFGNHSVRALTSGTSYLSTSAVHMENNETKSLASRLQLLHMGGCTGVNETSLLTLISEMPMLKNLCLRETQVVDNALCSFLGRSLEMLDISDTKTTGAALAHIISRNPGLKHLKAKGCRSLFHQRRKMECRESCNPSCNEWYTKLGKTCKLEELALGWGCSYFVIEVLKPAIRTLRVLNVGLGGSLSQDTLEILPILSPFLEAVILYFQVVSDSIVINIMRTLRHLHELSLCRCLGELSFASFKLRVPNLRKLRLERVTPWMTSDHLSILTENCPNLVELSLLGCRRLSSDSQSIISSGWPGLISIHLEDCGEITKNGVSSLFDCKALEELLLRHNGAGIQKNFISAATSSMPMLRKVSLDICDASAGDFDVPDFADRNFLSTVAIARCKPQRCNLTRLQIHGAVHKETLVLHWDSTNLTRTVIKERL